MFEGYYRGTPRGTTGVLEGYSHGTQKTDAVGKAVEAHVAVLTGVLQGYSRGTQGTKRTSPKCAAMIPS